MTLQEYLDGYNGWSPNEIANSLRWQNIRGERHSSINCPIANEIKLACGRYDISVWNTYIEYIEFNSKSWFQKLPVPRAISEFLHFFDHGHYPDLVERRP